ncbi:MAG TPA: hypothetical protein VIL86_02120 [Tepidisphaeraceae bacterium]
METEETVSKRPSGYAIWIFIVPALLAAGLFGVGIFLAARGHGWAVFAAGSASIVFVLAALPMALVMKEARKASMARLQEILDPIADRVEQQAILLNLISEQQLLSDRAKAVAFRENDREAIRRAIQEEIGRNDWEAATALANSIENEFGYRQEAERFREQINEKHRDAIRRQVTEAVAVVDRMTRAEQWSQALREAERLLRVFPDDPQVQGLPQEIESRRQTHKKRLRDSFGDAVARHDNDGAIEILKQLDMYLTPSEAEAMQETVRGVFKERLNTLKDQFSAAVQDHRWAEAVKHGEIIMRDFPNSRIALEVREKMDALRQRANEPMPVAAT